MSVDQITAPQALASQEHPQVAELWEWAIMAMSGSQRTTSRALYLLPSNLDSMSPLRSKGRGARPAKRVQTKRRPGLLPTMAYK